jgi:hypothetical protein
MCPSGDRCIHDETAALKAVASMICSHSYCLCCNFEAAVASGGGAVGGRDAVRCGRQGTERIGRQLANA